MDSLKNFEQQKKVELSESLGNEKFNNFLNVLTSDQFRMPLNKVFSSVDEAVEFFDFLFESEVIDDYFNTFNKSYLMHLHSILENSLNKICKNQEKQKDLLLKDIHGKGVERALIYLKKVCRIKIDPKVEADIVPFLKVRNKIIHNDSLIGGDEIDFFSKIEGIGIAKSDFDEEKNILIFDELFCKKSNEYVFSLLEEILDKISV